MQQQVHFYNLQGEKLAGTIHWPDIPKQIGLVLGHCFTCSRHTGILRQIAKDASERSFSVLRFDFSGNGQSEGEFSASNYTKQISEMQSAVDYLHEQGVERIGLAGHSMGALISVLTASRNNAIEAVCAIAGRLSGMNAAHFLNNRQKETLRNTGKVHFESRGRKLLLTDTFFSDAAHFDLPGILKNLQSRLLVVHGETDEIIPVEEAYTARDFKGNGIELVVIPEADHMFSKAADREKVSQIAVDWFEKQME